jgi:SNF2 family DNA or RNA helicase
MYPLLCKKNKVNGIAVCPVVLTSFEIPLREMILQKIKWSYIVVDEGHRLKNYKSMLARYTKIMYYTEKTFACIWIMQQSLSYVNMSLTFIFVCMFYTKFIT